MAVKVSKKFRQMCELYKLFASDSSGGCDFSDEAMQEMYDYETYGKGNIDISGFNTIGKKVNGYAVGKKWLNVTVAMWLEEKTRCLLHYEMTYRGVYADPRYPKWWLDKIFK